MDNIIDNIIKNTPLKTRLKVSNQLFLINAITELGYREDKVWTTQEEEQYYKLISLANKHTNELLTEIKEWKEDGEPN